MAGVGSSWGTREELLHPRDRHGRFRKKWKMAAGAVDALTGFLDRFSPRTFQSDQQASQYAFNSRKAPWTTPELQRLHMDWDEANESLQAGEMDPTTKRFVEMMDRNMVETTDDLIVSQTMPTEAFGLSPQQAALEDGGLEDLIGLEIGDAGYSMGNLGSELSHPPGSVTIRMAVPKGTRVAYGGRSPSDRSLAFDRDQPFVVTKVESDGRGGYYMLAVAASGKRTKGAAPVADDRTFGRRGAGLTPQQREARITPQMSGEQRLRIAQQNEREMQTGPSAVTPAPSQGAPSPAPAAPTSQPTSAPPAAGVPERREPVQSEAIGPGSPEGKSPSDIAGDAETARVQAENAPPAPAAAPTPLEFQEAARDLPIPTSGPQRNEWNKAHRDLAQGRRDPNDVLRELDTDIEENKRKAATATHAEKKDSLERNIQAQEQLADLIAEKYGVQRRTTSAPVTKKAPAATPGAPSTKRGTAPTVKAPTPRSGRGRKPADVAADIQAATSLEEANAHLEGMTGAELKALADHMEAPVRARATKAQLRQAITFRKGRELDSDAVSGQGAARRAAEAEATAKKAAPETRTQMRERTAGPGLTDEQKADVTAKAARADERVRKEMEDFDAKNKADLDPLLEAAGLQESDLDALDKTGASLILGQVREKKISKTEGIRRLKESRSDRLKALGNALEGQPRKAAPAKAVAKKAVPAKAVPTPDAAEEAFKARVAEAGLPDKVADLRAQARDQKIRGFSTMNKRQLQSALLGDEVPKAGKIAPATPKKLVPHIQAAESDQAARKLLENHTLADLRAMAKDDSVGVTLPSRGVTKDKAKDAILEAIRGGPEGGGGETPARSLRQELDAQKWVSPEDSVAKRAIEDILSDTNEMDAAELRDGRDKLENLSKDLRANGKRQDANLTQTLADTMGMRAQVISGVEEGPARAPAKRAIKKAVPEVAGPEAPKTLDKMLKPELAQVAADEKVPGIRKSMTKAQLREAIERDRRVRAGKDSGTADNPLKRAPTPEEIARDTAPDAPPAKRAKARALKRVPEGSVAGPRPDAPIDNPTRASSFTDSWNDKGFAGRAHGAAGRSMDEIRDDVGSGKITPEEGIRRMESEISFGKEDLADIEAQLRGGNMSKDDRADLVRRRAQLKQSIEAQTDASSFMRSHFKDEAPITRQELEVQLDAPEKAALDRVDVDGLKEAARQDGLGDIEGDDKDTVIQNIAKAVAGRELKERAAKKAAPTGVSTPEQPPVKAAPGTAAGRITTSRLTPGTRILVERGKTEGLVMPTTRKTGSIPVTVTKVEGARGEGSRRSGYMVTVTDDDGNELKLGLRPGSQTHMLEPPLRAPKATKKAAKAAPDQERAQLRDEAVRSLQEAGLGDASQDMIEARMEQLRSPRTPQPKAAVPAKAAPKVVDLDNPTRHDAELIGTGLDLDAKGEDRQWMDVVQRSLDRGEDGRQIADGLRREADSQRTLHNITESVGGTEGASPAARINRMELMADRLEGVRPIQKATPAKAAPRVQEYGTMQASTAASRARADLKSGKSHAEVATALRRAATGVASREHDPQMVRPVEFTPSERSAMKRSDAKKLRDLAAEIQAEGVAQRAAAKAAKKAPAKKAAPATSDDDRKNLTGPIGEVIKAQLDDTMRRLQEADSPAAEDSALAGLLTPELRQLAQRLGLDSRGSKATLLQRIKDRTKGREAPGVSAERAVPKAEAPGGLTTQPPKPHEWGNLRGQVGDGHYFHPDGQIPMAMDRLGADAQIDVGGGESLHNAMGDIATDMVMGRISPDAGIARLRALSTKLPAGSEARRRVAALAEDLDRPAVPMPKLPDDTPAPVRALVQQMLAFPIARTKGRYGGSSYETSLIDKVKAFLDEKASGNSSLVGMSRDLAQLIQGHTHESQEGSMGLGALSRPLFDDNSAISKALQQWAKEIRARR